MIIRSESRMAASSSITRMRDFMDHSVSVHLDRSTPAAEFRPVRSARGAPETLLVEDRHAQRPAPSRACCRARRRPRRSSVFLLTELGHPPARASIAAVASSRDRPVSVPVSTNVLPASGPAAAGDRRLRRRRSGRQPRAAAPRAPGSAARRSTRAPTAATTGPMSSTAWRLLDRGASRAPRSTRTRPPAPARPARPRGGCRGRTAAARARAAGCRRSADAASRPTSAPSARAPRAGRRVRLIEVGEIAARGRSPTTWSTSASPSPSMFIARRDAKCSRLRRSRAGHAVFTHRQTASSSGRCSAAAAARALRRASATARRSGPRRESTGPTTFGMTSPPFSMMHVVAGADVAARDLLLVVQRRHLDRRSRQPDRLEHGERRHRARAPDVHVDPQQLRRGLLGRELERDGPARELRRRPGLLPERQVVQLDDDAVGVERQRVPPVAPPLAVRRARRRRPRTAASALSTGSPHSRSRSSVLGLRRAGRRRAGRSAGTRTPTARVAPPPADRGSASCRPPRCAGWRTPAPRAPRARG